jgi:hypothetical protein
MIQKLHWTLDGIPWHKLRREYVADSEELFYLVTSASFVETASDLYARNLVQHFADDHEVSSWLECFWEPEELQHGRALREYVRHAWPDFDWETQYARFFEDNSAVCKPEFLLPERSLELASRCVVEMGTASYYTSLHQASAEPVLMELTRHIFEDEVGHYKYFYKYFRHYRATESPSRAQVLGALWRRLKLIEQEDGYIVLKHIHCTRHPDQIYGKAIYKDAMARCRKLAAKHFPYQMSAKMFLKPLEMAPIVRRVVQPFVQGVARLVIS